MPGEFERRMVACDLNWRILRVCYDGTKKPEKYLRDCNKVED